MALIEGSNNSELFATALSQAFDELEMAEKEEEKDSFSDTLPSFKNFLDHNTGGLPCSTPKRAYDGLIRKRILPKSTASAEKSPPGPSLTPEEVARIVIPKQRKSPLPKLPPVVLTPWSKMIREAMLKKEQEMKKSIPAPRMSMRL